MKTMIKKVDSIYASPKEQKPFSFDENVVEVFPDMINRSVPGYKRIISGIGQLSNQFIKENTVVYDLGCSLGEATLSIRNHANIEDFEIIGIDNSEAMVTRCKQHMNAYKSHVKTTIIQEDINSYQFKPCSLVVLNFTLQFLAISERKKLLEKINHALVKGGALILSEKIDFEDKRMSQLFIDMHHQFKKNNGYSDLEIAQKRAALEEVMLPESKEVHFQRLQQTGFKHVNCWFQDLNFCSMVAIK